MAFRVKPLTKMHWQALDLNCGIYCLEALMQWKHGAVYGKKTAGLGATPEDNDSKLSKKAPVNSAGAYSSTYGAALKEHEDSLKTHWKKLGSHGFELQVPSVMKHYGLFYSTYTRKSESWKKSPPGLDWYEKQLKTYGPILAGGRLGGLMNVMKYLGGHWVLVVGVTGDKIEYQDPLDPKNALGQPVHTISLANFNEAVAPKNNKGYGDVDPMKACLLSAYAE